MNGFPCCCDCDIGADDFDRATIGSDWTQIAGTWSISSNRLTTTDNNALAIFSAEHPGGKSSAILNFSGTVSTATGALRGIVSFDSATNYLYVEWSFGTGCSSVKFYQVATGNTTQLGTTRTVPLLTAGTFYDFSVCYKAPSYPGNDGEIVGVVTIPGLGFGGVDAIIRFGETVTAAEDGNQVGLGTGGLASGSATFEDFDWDDHKETKGSCEDCRSEDNCLIIDEHFDGALDCNWDEASGSWTVAGGAVTTGNAGARLVSFRENVRPGYDKVALEFSGGEGDEVSVIVDFASALEFHRITATIGDAAGAGSEIRIYKGTSLIAQEDTTAGAVAGGTHFLHVCVVGELIEASISNNAFVAFGAQGESVGTTLFGGSGLAIGTETAAGTLTFKRVLWEQGRSPAAPECRGCITTEECTACIDDDGPTQFKVTIGGMGAVLADAFFHCCADSDCLGINGTYILNTNDLWGGCTWSGGGPFCECDPGYPPIGTIRPMSIDLFAGFLPRELQPDWHRLGPWPRPPWMPQLPPFDSEGRFFLRVGMAVDWQPGSPCEYGYWVWYRSTATRNFPTQKIDCENITNLQLQPWRVSDAEIALYFNGDGFPAGSNCVLKYPCSWTGSAARITAI